MKLSKYSDKLRKREITLKGEDYYKAEDVNEILEEIDLRLSEVITKIEEITDGLF